MRSKKEQQQLIIVSVLFAMIVAVLLFFFWRKFLPGPTGVPVLLPPPTRMNLPPATAADDQLYDRPDFKALLDAKNVPVRPVELNGTGSPFDDITPR